MLKINWLRRENKYSKKGFSLIELLIIIVLIWIMLIVAFNNFGQNAPRRDEDKWYKRVQLDYKFCEEKGTGSIIITRKVWYTPVFWKTEKWIPFYYENWLNSPIMNICEFKQTEL